MLRDWESICHETITIVRQTAHYIEEASRNFKRGNEDEKAPNSFVTEIDLSSEKRLVERLGRMLPEAGFITEENTVANESKEMSWIIDPLDGTTNFIHGIPSYAISVALLVDNQIQLGVVLELTRSECFYAIHNEGAFCNGKPIKVSTCTTFQNGLYATGFPYNSEETPAYLNILKTFLTNTRGIRRLGSAAVDLAYVACGKFDGFYEHKLNAWDVAAGALIVQEAGGKVTDFNGGDDYLFGGEIIASNQQVHSSIHETVQSVFK